MELPFSIISEEEFADKFATEEQCLSYLSSVKWSEGYVCKKCGHTNYCEGKQAYSRRCTRCKYDESAKIDTLFEGCRFPLPKAFYIAYHVCHGGQESIQELSQKLDLRQMTCWSFKHKLLECVRSSQLVSPDKKIVLEKLILNSTQEK